MVKTRQRLERLQTSELNVKITISWKVVFCNHKEPDVSVGSSNLHWITVEDNLLETC